MDYQKYFYFLFPIILVYIVSIIYPVGSSAGAQVSFRPPPYVFAIAWPILLILTGYSWTLRPELSTLYFILTLLIAGWCVVYFYSIKLAFVEIILTEIFTLFLIFYKFQQLSSYLLIPLAMWLAFASVLNYYSM